MAFLQVLAWILGFLWGLCGIVIAFSAGRSYLWRIAVFLGPFASLLLPSDERPAWLSLLWNDFGATVPSGSAAPLNVDRPIATVRAQEGRASLSLKEQADTPSAETIRRPAQRHVAKTNTAPDGTQSEGHKDGPPRGSPMIESSDVASSQSSFVGTQALVVIACVLAIVSSTVTLIVVGAKQDSGANESSGHVTQQDDGAASAAPQVSAKSESATNSDRPAEVASSGRNSKVEGTQDLLDQGKHWLDQHEYDKAITAFSSVIRTDPRNAFTFLRRSWAWAGKQEYEKAVEDINEAIRLAPQESIFYVSRASIRTTMKEHEKAFLDLNEAIRIDPSNAVAFRDRSSAWRLKGEPDIAIADCTEAIRLNPRYADAFVARASLWTAKREQEKALEDYGEAIRIDPQNYWVYDLRGHLWLEFRKDRDKAILDFSQAIRLAPRTLSVYYHRLRADLLAEKQDFDGAISDYSEMIRIEPKSNIHYLFRALLWKAKSENSKVVTDCTEAIRLQPKADAARTVRANAWYALREYQNAIAGYNEAIQFAPMAFGTYNNLADLLASCPDPRYRDGARAVNLATKANELTKWERPEFLETLAAAYAETGDFSSAVGWQKKAMERFAAQSATNVEDSPPWWIKALDLIDDDHGKKDHEYRLSLYRRRLPYRHSGH